MREIVREDLVVTKTSAGWLQVRWAHNDRIIETFQGRDLKGRVKRYMFWLIKWYKENGYRFDNGRIVEIE